MLSPSDFEWWIWLLIAVGAGVCFIIALVITAAANDRDLWIVSIPFGLVALVCALGALACLFIGIVRFAKWAWSG
jgi:hypothetical protein